MRSRVGLLLGRISSGALVLFAFLLFSAILHLPREVEHWSVDLVASTLSTQLSTQVDNIVLVYVTDATLKDKPYVSPIDRGVVADLVVAADRAGAKVIGLDMLLDRFTEKPKDEKLCEIIHNARAKVVVGVIEETPSGRHAESDYFLKNLGTDRQAPQAGHLYFDDMRSWLVVSDHVIRSMAPTLEQNSALLTLGASRSFAEVVASAAGSKFEPRSRRIDWLLKPKDGDEIFKTLPAEFLLRSSNDELTHLISGKIVLIGGGFMDRDRHLTPMSVSRDDFYQGLWIHAQVLAQLLSKRTVLDIDPRVEWPLATFVFLLAGYLGVRSGGYQFWLEVGGVLLLFVAGIIAFAGLRIIFPFNLWALAWLSGAAVGHHFGSAHMKSAATNETDKQGT
jgi:adenylate cyclase